MKRFFVYFCALFAGFLLGYIKLGFLYPMNEMRLYTSGLKRSHCTDSLFNVHFFVNRTALYL